MLMDIPRCFKKKVNMRLGRANCTTYGVDKVLYKCTPFTITFFGLLWQKLISPWKGFEVCWSNGQRICKRRSRLRVQVLLQYTLTHSYIHTIFTIGTGLVMTGPTTMVKRTVVVCRSKQKWGPPQRDTHRQAFQALWLYFPRVYPALQLR